MKVKGLIEVLQGIYNANPEAEVFCEIEKTYAKCLAKVAILDNEFIDSYGVLDIVKLSTWCKDGDGFGVLLRLESTNYEDDFILAKDAEKFDEKYNIK